MTSTVRSSKRRRAWVIVAALSVILVIEAGLFVFPPTDEAKPADAIVVFGGPGDRVSRASELVEQGVAPAVVISVDDLERCPPEWSGVELFCLAPDPLTTRGEARAFAHVAQEQGWENLVVVSTATQNVRARLRLGRCHDGEALFVTMRESVVKQLYRVVYENGAMLKALFLERGC